MVDDLKAAANKMASPNQAFLTSMAVISVGYTARKWNVLPEESGKVLSRVILYLTFPALIYQTFARVNVQPSLIYLPLICLLYGALVLAFSLYLFREKPDALKGLLAMAVAGFNIGLFAFPLIEGVWGMQGLQYAAMFDIGNACIVLGLTYVTGAIYSPRRDPGEKVGSRFVVKKLLGSFPLQMYVLALVVNLAGVQTPIWIADIIGVLARANMALVLVLLGIYLDFDWQKFSFRTIGSVLLIRYGFGLTLGLGLFFLLPFDLIYRSIVLIGLILPVGLTILPFSQEFGYDQKLAGSLASVTIVLSFSLMWLLISWLHLA